MNMITRHQDALRQPRRPTAKTLLLRTVACLTLSAAITGITVNSPLLDEARAETAPNARAIIRANLETRIRDDDPESVTAIESLIFPPARRVSDVAVSTTQERTLTDLYGWAWRSCMRATVDDLRTTLAVFIANGRVVSARTALIVDHCDNANYVSLPFNRAQPAAKPKGPAHSRSKANRWPEPAAPRRND
jgi:hypothetical protein